MSHDAHEGTITSLPVHALFSCCRCGELCERLTRAKVTCGGIGAAERPAGEVVCNGCMKKKNKRPKPHKLRLAI
jgi:hypothetical protein